MVIKARLILALVFLVLSVLVDFTSTILSVLSDGALVAVAVTLVWPILKTASKDQWWASGILLTSIQLFSLSLLA
ncbi:DUF3927 family protein [Escherichia coli]